MWLSSYLMKRRLLLMIIKRWLGYEQLNQKRRCKLDRRRHLFKFTASLIDVLDIQLREIV